MSNAQRWHRSERVVGDIIFYIHYFTHSEHSSHTSMRFSHIFKYDYLITNKPFIFSLILLISYFLLIKLDVLGMTTYDFVMKQRSLLEQQEEQKAKRKIENKEPIPEKNLNIPSTVSFIKKIKLRINSIFKRNRIQIEPKKDPEPLSIISGNRTVAIS